MTDPVRYTSLVDPLGAPLVARDDPDAPFPAPPIGALDPRPRHRDRRTKAGRQRSQALSVPVASANRANSLRSGSAGQQSCVKLGTRPV